jgi:hypothetical protein
MKTKAAILFLLTALGTAPAFAQDEETKPDYSRETLQRFVAAIPDEPKHEPRFHFYWGAITFNALGQRFRIGAPLAPLSGSIMRTTQEWPDPFSLTGTAIATPKRAWNTQRKLNAEMKRIEKSERAKIKVTTN